RAEYTPGAPFNTSTNKPESSARVGLPVISDKVFAFLKAFSSKVSPSSSTSGNSGKSVAQSTSIPSGFSNSENSKTLFLFFVARRRVFMFFFDENGYQINKYKS